FEEEAKPYDVLVVSLNAASNRINVCVYTRLTFLYGKGEGICAHKVSENRRRAKSRQSRRKDNNTKDDY
ncbi:hypothetical protein ALC62_07467, partial [Cyphomyrmex costatus]